MALKLIPPDGKKYKCFYIRGTVAKGRRIFESTGTAKRREAQLILDKYEKDRLNGKLGLKISPFVDMAVGYVADRNPGTTQRNAIIGAENKDGSLRPCLLTDFAHIKDCREIDQEAATKVIKQRFKTTKHGKPYKPGTIMREFIAPLTCVLTYAAGQNYCDEPYFVRESYNDKRERYGTDEECAAILRASAPHVAPIFLFAMYIGDRIGESVDLQIEDVNIAKSWAVLRDTKNGTSRGIALHRQIAEILRVIIGDRKTGAVFLTDDGLPYKTYPKTAWNGACRRAGIENFRLHDLRHTFGTISGMAGVTTRQQEKQMGHLNSTMNGRYVHVPDDELIAAINRIPWRDYPYHTDRREWVRLGFGKAGVPAPI
jgi:integrase